MISSYIPKEMKHAFVTFLLVALSMIVGGRQTACGQDEKELPKVPAAILAAEADFVTPAKVNTKAKVYFIYLSRYSCDICVAEAPSIVKTYKNMKGKGAELTMINIDEDKETAAKWVKKEKMKFPVVAPGKGSAIPFPYDGPGTLPHMVAVDADGNKLGQANGSGVSDFLKNWKQLVREVEKKEKEAAKAAKKAAEAERKTKSDEE